MQQSEIITNLKATIKDLQQQAIKDKKEIDYLNNILKAYTQEVEQLKEKIKSQNK